MNFAEQLQDWGDRTAVITAGGETIDYATLARLSDDYAEHLGHKHSISLIRCRNRLPSLIAYLACLRHRRVALLIDDDLPETQIRQLVERFGIRKVIASDGSIIETNIPETLCREDLALLLSTSGSTGSPKLVMLSAANLHANAESICAYLPIDSDDTAIAHLALHYSYGLSIVNTHLLSGAAISLTEASVVSRDFWSQFRRDRINSFSGVPQHYLMLRQLRFERMDLPHLRYLTQAGGKLHADQVRYFSKLATDRGQTFYVMYGQTEASARMAYLPPESAFEHPDSIGIAIPQGRLWLQSEQGKVIENPHTTGELHYRGPNVMLGYAEQAEDLNGNDGKLETLATGDLAYFDEAGFFTLVGRIKRYIKIYGRRINLDELEQQLGQQGFQTLCSGSDDNLLVACLKQTSSTDVKRHLFEHYHFHPTHVKAIAIDTPPLTANGKIDYQRLSTLAYD